MIVTVTKFQLASLRDTLDEAGWGWVNDHWLSRAELKRDMSATYECVMPYIGWAVTLGIILEATAGPLGGNRADVRLSLLRARQRIAQDVGMRAAHPALSGIGLPGHRTELIPAWPTGTPRVYSPAPTRGEFVVLVPEPQGSYTMWFAESPPVSPEPLFNPQEHWRFVRGVAPAATA